jgi:hypothetical protein
MYFQGKTIYSYGSHFPMAKLIGSGAVLLTYRTYSNTTTKHLSHVRKAISHMDVISCYNPSWGLIENLSYEQHRITGQMNILKNKRTRQITKDGAAYEIQIMVSNATKYCEAFDTTLDAEIAMMKASSDESFQRAADLWSYALDLEGFDLEAAAEEREARVAKIKAAVSAERKLKNKAELKKWLKGDNNYWRLNSDLTPLMLRKVDDVVETTLGAKVPYEHAKRLYGLIKAGLDIADHHVGNYKASCMREGSLIIGCHTIPQKEIQRFAKLNNW